MIQLIKTAAGSAAALLIAKSLGLNSYASAGIITLLTIQNTSRETIEISLKRLAAFLIATVYALLFFTLFGFHAVSFGLFLLAFMGTCTPLKLRAAVSTNAVLASHYLAAGAIGPSAILNEAQLLLIGSGIGMLMNLYMPGKVKQIRAIQRTLEEDLKNVLLRMSVFLQREDKTGYDGECFQKLEHDISLGLKYAYENMNNTFFQETKYFIQYMEMRRQQCEILESIYKKILPLNQVPAQANEVAVFIAKIAASFGESNNAKSLLEECGKLYVKMKNSSLPVTREEFEHRAFLYFIIIDLENFLNLKAGFADSLSQEQISKYWQDEA